MSTFAGVANLKIKSLARAGSGVPLDFHGVRISSVWVGFRRAWLLSE